jgi:hypothetical protein
MSAKASMVLRSSLPRITFIGQKGSTFSYSALANNLDIGPQGDAEWI